MLTFDQIKELAELVAERGLASVEVERSGFRVRIDGPPAARSTSEATAAPAPARETAAPEPSTPSPATVPEPAPDQGEEGSPPAGVHVLDSPIVGTFYRAPSPDADPYVEVGSRVKAGQVLCIVEAMKLMNEIESDADGEIVEIYPKNAQPVEFGEPLFAIRED